MSKKVCIWCERWGAGGIESFIVNVLEAMDMEGLELSIFTVQNESDVFDGRLEKLGVRKNILISKPSFSPLMRTYLAFKFFTGEMERGQFDVIHLNIYHGVALNYARLAKKAGVPIRIVHSHNAALRPSATKPIKQLAHWICKALLSKYATDFCACSDVAAKWMFPRRFESRAEMIANGVDTSRFAFDPEKRRQFREELGIGDRLALCCIGRICSQKNQVFLVEAFSEILKLKPNALLYLAGSEEDGGAARKRVEELNISKSVVFLGVTSWIPELLWACDIFVLPSLFEGNPVSGIEAQASGIKCFFSGNISRDAGITPLAEFVPLSDGPVGWAMKILAAADYRREDVSAQMTAAGYDVKTSAQRLKELYTRG